MEVEQGKQVTDYAWLDLSTGTVSFAISERITLSLPLEEMMDFLDTVVMISETLKNTEGVSIGTYEKDGVTYEQFMLTPEEDDFN
jgi:hypothetical protein|tara:strand:- start:163 stop:417 length:255 start_codon:yes stop_codon:yes gene_type:complete